MKCRKTSYEDLIEVLKECAEGNPRYRFRCGFDLNNFADTSLKVYTEAVKKALEETETNREMLRKYSEEILRFYESFHKIPTEKERLFIGEMHTVPCSDNNFMSKAYRVSIYVDEKGIVYDIDEILMYKSPIFS